jgi:hypothetical protein
MEDLDAETEHSGAEMEDLDAETEHSGVEMEDLDVEMGHFDAEVRRLDAVPAQKTAPPSWRVRHRPPRQSPD